jgi:DNA-binding NarL/FixJ family response regulator
MPEWFAFAGHGVSIDLPLLRTLVVEDYAPFRRLVCAALQERAEFQTIEGADGLEADQKAEELQPDLILLDEPRVARLVLRRLVSPLTLWDESERPDFVKWEATPKAGLLDGLATLSFLRQR